jgi:hypothetical protein
LKLATFARNKLVKHQRLLFSQRNKMKLRFIGLTLLIIANVAFAAPKHVKLVYQAIRADKPFAIVTETYDQSGQQYKIESVTEGIGVYALFGKRILKSEGLVTTEGLQPLHFESHQGDAAKKSVFAEFDWPNQRLTMKAKGKESSDTLLKDSQDIASYVYQWMLVAPAGDEVTLSVTTGKKLRQYTYNIISKGDVMETPAGQFKVIELSNAGKVEAADEKHIWLATERDYLPVRILMQDDKGVVIEQILTSIETH